MDPTVAGANRVQVHGGSLSADGQAAPLAIGAEPKVIGRNAGCDLVLADKRVSAAHLEVMATDRGVRLRDLGSKNGTFVEEVRIDQAYLTKATTLRCGDTRLTFTPAEPETHRTAHVHGFGHLVGSSPVMLALFERLERAAPTMLTVLITGETGTGKEVVARTLHDASPRAKKAFVALNCAAVPESLLEPELFGHEKGAFTGADRARPGLFVEADGGTLFLDELGEMSPAMQAKLLRVLEEREVRPVGGTRSRKVDVRVLAATRRDLVREVNSDRFRSDLFFRLAQMRVELPSLRQRPDDIPALVQRLLEGLGATDAYRRVTAESLVRLARHDWPGNVRELKNVIAVALAYDNGGPLDLAEHLTLDIGGASTASRAPSQAFADAKRDMEKAYFTALYAAVNGNISELARRAELDRKTARDYLRKHGMAVPEKGEK